MRIDSFVEGAGSAPCSANGSAHGADLFHSIGLLLYELRLAKAVVRPRACMLLNGGLLSPSSYVWIIRVATTC
jgi:hypothetical protein